MLLLASFLNGFIMTGCEAERPIHVIRDRADYLYRQGDYARAAVEYEEIVARYPGDWEGQYMFGRTLLRLGQPTEARRALEIAHTRKSDDPDIADALAEAMYQQGDAGELFAFLRDRAQSEQSVRAYVRLAEYAMKLNDPDSATVAIDTAIQLDDGKYVAPYVVAAELAESRGQMDLAVRRLWQAYGIDPYNEEVKASLKRLGEVPGPTGALPPGR